MLFFLGLITGGIPQICKKINFNSKNISFIILSFLIFTTISFLNSGGNYIVKNNFIDYFVYFLSGILEAIGTVVPGISATALLLLVGTYENIINVIGNITNFDIIKETLGLLLPFSIGLFIGVIVFTYFISFLLANHKSLTFSVILGTCISTIIMLFIKVIMVKVLLFDIFVGVILYFLGFCIANILEK